MLFPIAPSETTLKKYGITASDYLRLYRKQNGCCAICGRPPRTRRLNVDHDHKIKGAASVRGLLCYSCNYGLGVFRDNVDSLAKASLYLRRFQIEGTPEVHKHLESWKD